MSEKHYGDLQYKICGTDRIIDEKGSAFIALRRIAWGVPQDAEVEDESKIKVDIRKYYNTPDGERMNKGVSFLTEEGPNELAHVLLEEGFGDTGKCIKILKDRDDIKEAITFAYDLEPTEDTKFYDPRDLLNM